MVGTGAGSGSDSPDGVGWEAGEQQLHQTSCRYHLEESLKVYVEAHPGEKYLEPS